MFLRGGRRKRREDEGQKWEERLQENWENCAVLNLSYQDLGDPYQLENFIRILRRLIRVERLQLVDNALRDLSSVRLPRCKILNLHRNNLTSIRKLPKVPEIQHLCLSENSISSLGELTLLRSTPLRSLTLKRNPCQFLEDYRSRVFSCLPKLQVLDGIPKLQEDSMPLSSPAASRSCTIL
ncbi:protein tilB homolog [Carassius auratus]|uniref:Protein tilB homolog n=1 Tax=Carassius auratus TaxID=7957 RepID=A0A6P6NEF6_CARAU|nr:protein tilB homolog [Carassius auratus]